MYIIYKIKWTRRQVFFLFLSCLNYQCEDYVRRSGSRAEEAKGILNFVNSFMLFKRFSMDTYSVMEPCPPSPPSPPLYVIYVCFSKIHFFCSGNKFICFYLKYNAVDFLKSLKIALVWRGCYWDIVHILYPCR